MSTMILPRFFFRRSMVHVTRLVVAVPGLCWALSWSSRCPHRATRSTSYFSFRGTISPRMKSSMRVTSSESLSSRNPEGSAPSEDGRFLIHWKGEDVEGYSLQFRHLEFCGALGAVLHTSKIPNVRFSNALKYRGGEEMPEIKLSGFNEAMQYVDVSRDSANKDQVLSRKALIAAAKRCSLIHAAYQIVAEGDTYSELGLMAMSNGGFNDMMVGGINQDDTWCVRVRRYGETLGDDPKEKRYSSRARSMKLETEALKFLKPLLLKFGGRVHLDQPDCKIYIFDGLEGEKKVLARRITTGPKTSFIAPNTRICVTNTPLCPIAAFSMCNIAAVRDNYTVLDPFAGSCTILLAAAMIAPKSRTVGIEIAHNGLVDRDDIRKDFSSRGFSLPVDLIHGDCNRQEVRDAARKSIGNQPFDVIVTDPPYGIRERKNLVSPLVELFLAISHDRNQGKPLLRRGGKLVTFVPCNQDEELSECMPSNDQVKDAGLRIDEMREQPLNSVLSRWLVVYTSV